MHADLQQFPGKLTVTGRSTHQSPLDQRFAMDRSIVPVYLLTCYKADTPRLAVRGQFRSHAGIVEQAGRLSLWTEDARTNPVQKS